MSDDINIRQSKAPAANYPIVYALIAGGISGLFFWFGAKWLWQNRLGGLMDIDEAGYFGIAIFDYFALSKYSPIGWIGALTVPSIQSPLTTALASLLFAVTGPAFIYGYLVPVACGAVTVFATYKLTEKISGPQAGLVACLLVATCPVIIAYSRSFHFAIPATAVMTLALLAALQSARFSKRNWSIAFGVFVGLLPLTRTMTIAFIPGVLFGAFLYLISTSDDRRQRRKNFLIAIGVSIMTAATWLIFTARYVADYLFSFGYGSRAAEYGQERILFSIDTLRRALQIIAFDVFIPHFLLICIGLICALVVGAKAARSGPKEFLLGMLQSPLIILATTGICGLIALASSRNQGSAFVAPLLPPIIIFAVCQAWAVSPSRLYHLGVELIVGMAAIVVALPYIGNYSSLAERRMLLPFVGPVPVSDNRGTIQIYLDRSSSHPNGRDPASAPLWSQLIKRTNAAIVTHGGDRPFVAQGFRHHIYNTNTIQLDHLISAGERWHLVFIQPVVTGESVEGYRTWLTTGDAAEANLLLTAPGDDGEFRPLVQTAALEEAARGVGFEPVDRWAMPNDRQVTLWKRNISPASR
jgi:4-amino-4-deoxy-L-arabinose transferase-like glycosyltransferase